MAYLRIEDMDFRPRLPVGRLTLACLVFGFLGWAFVNEKRFEFDVVAPPTTAAIVEAFCIGLFLLSGFVSLTSFLLLQFRLRFTEAGIRRFTLFGPRFVRWNSVSGARVVRFRGYYGLELKVRRYRWINVPLLEYGGGARLLAEISSRVPVKVQALEKHIALISDLRPD